MHHENEEYHSNIGVVWNVVKNKSNKHLNSLENAEHTPEGEPFLLDCIIGVFDSRDRLDNWVNACKKGANNVVTVHQDSKYHDCDSCSRQNMSWPNTVLLALSFELRESLSELVELIKGVV